MTTHYSIHTRIYVATYISVCMATVNLKLMSPHSQGTNLHRVPESDYSVTVGGQPCTELDINEAGTAITCLPPQSVSVFAQENLALTVRIVFSLHCLDRLG